MPRKAPKNPPEPESPPRDQHIWFKKSSRHYECRFCHARGGYGWEPEGADIGPCEAVIHRYLIHDVAEEIADERESYYTRETAADKQYFTRFARDLAADVGFAGEIIKAELGESNDAYKGAIIAEVFREIRAERRRLQPIDGMIRIDQAVYVERTGDEQ